jgi:hypothetical protein
VSRALAEASVNFLGFSETTGDHLGGLKGFDRREWDGTLTWLHDAGLALHLLQKLKDTKAIDILPTSTWAHLEENLAANRRRVAYMARQFDFINQHFNRGGVRYAVVKGCSMVPQFCPDASLRHQGDFDYLVDTHSLPMAQRVLEGAGYSLKKRTANEFVYLMTSASVPPSADGQYEAHAPHAVELRLAFWDSDSHSVPLTDPGLSVDNAVAQYWQGLVFPALPEEDAFLVQVIHAFNHILTGWVRMSWLYEIGYFFNRRSTDVSLWERLDRRIGSDKLLREMVVVVGELSAHLFRAPLPSTSGIWTEKLRPAVQIWIHHYARTWIFEDTRADQFSLFPVAKLALFFHQQYLSDASLRRHVIRTRLFPLEKLFRRVHSITSKSSTQSGGRGWQLERALIRLIFHVTGGLRYLWEIPRWERLNKENAHLAPSIRREPAATDVPGAPATESTIRL